MKILRVALCDIASMAGQQVVDFTREPLASTGLFSIIGPTGSGKSTLLDAICLALYNDTPRLSQVKSSEKLDDLTQQDSRSLLRRGRGLGWSEVVFEGGDAQVYTAHWQVRRARGKADGRFQQVEMALYRGSSDVNSGAGELLASGKLTEVKIAIVDKVGLTFEQFTRAVLLAQNEFAAFLKADDKARAEILQTLTGTDQFERISKRVYDRAKAAKEELSNLESAIAATAPLPEAERNELDQQLAQADAGLRTTRQSAQQAEKRQAWFERLRTTEQQLQQAQQTLQIASETSAAAEPRRSELRRAEIIFEQARSLVDTLRSAVNQLQKRAETDAAAQQAQQQASTAKDAAEQLLTGVQTALAEQQQIARKAEPALQQARVIEAALPELQMNVGNAQQLLQTRATEHQQAAKALQTLREEIDGLNEACELSRQMLQQLSAWETFTPSRDLWLSRLESLQSMLAERRSTRTTVDKHEAELQTLQQQLAQFDAVLNELAQTVQTRTETLQQAIQAVDDFQSEDPEKSVSRLESEHDRLKELCELLQKRDKAATDLQTLSEQLQTDRDQQTALQEQLEQQQRSLQTARQMAEQIILAVDDAAERLRSQLNPDSPCPVCGSTEHPWHESEDAPSQAALQAAKAAVQAHTAAESETTRQLAHLAAAISSAESRQPQLQTELDSARQTLATSTLPEDAAAVLQQSEIEQQQSAAAFLQQRQQQLSAARKQREQLSTLRNTQDEARREMDTAKDALQQKQNDRQQLDKQATTLQSQYDSAAQNLAGIEARIEAAETQLQELWTTQPDLRAEFETQPVLTIELVRQNTALYHQTAEALQQQQSQLQNSSARIEDVEAAAEKAAAAFAAQTEATTTLTTKLAQQRIQLTELLGEYKSADELRQHLENAVQAAEQAATAAQEGFATANTEQTKASTAATTAAQELQNAADVEQSCRTALEEWIASQQTDPDKPLTRELVETVIDRGADALQDERHALQKLADAVNTAKGSVTTCQQNVEQHAGTRDFEDSEETVLAELRALTTQLQEREQGTNQLRARVTSDDNKRTQQSAQSVQLEQKKAAARPLLQLNDLIGSADGNKFRELAQQRTLDVLLRDTNFQLHQLTPRYRLERIKDSLNLLVVDQDMGDEQRSVHSLSGGETFLVSLSLALGLAALASNRLKIESLFIDEGFGTLDEETLRTATNALMHLESQGRKVGVITHVAEMKDTIPVQVRVQRTGNGASRVVTPNVAR